MKAMIIPGNGNTEIRSNWYMNVKQKLENLGIEVVATNMPDPDLARRSVWIPFIEKQMNKTGNSILIGHSSGAVAIMRYLEDHKAAGAVLVGAYYTDLGDRREKESGYFDDEWKWNSIKNNCKWIIQFASVDDPYIPVEEARHIRSQLNTEYHEFSDRGHFGSDKENSEEFPEIIEEVKKKINNYYPNNIYI